MRYLLPVLFSFCTVASSAVAHADTVASSSASAFASATTGESFTPFLNRATMQPTKLFQVLML